MMSKCNYGKLDLLEKESSSHRQNRLGNNEEPECKEELKVHYDVNFVSYQKFFKKSKLVHKGEVKSLQFNMLPSKQFSNEPVGSPLEPDSLPDKLKKLQFNGSFGRVNK